MRASALVTALVVGSTLAGCGGGSGSTSASSGAPSPSTTAPAARLAGTVQGLCAARAQAGGDPGAARTTFYDRSHEGIHTIARELEGSDRATAARLLEAKEAVEADLALQPPKPSLAADLGTLVDVTRQSLSRLGVTAGPCR